MKMNQPAGKDHLSGVTCDVCNCVYNNDTHECHAPSIEIGPQDESVSGDEHADTAADTVCATFKADTQG